MCISAPWADSLEIIALLPVKKCLGINPMGLSAPRAKYLQISSLQTVKHVMD